MIRPSQIDESCLYSVSDAAHMVCMSPDGIREAIREGKLAAQELSPRRRYIEGRELKRWLKAKLRRAATKARGDRP